MALLRDQLFTVPYIAESTPRSSPGTPPPPCLLKSLARRTQALTAAPPSTPPTSCSRPGSTFRCSVSQFCYSFAFPALLERMKIYWNSWDWCREILVSTCNYIISRYLSLEICFPSAISMLNVCAAAAAAAAASLPDRRWILLCNQCVTSMSCSRDNLGGRPHLPVCQHWTGLQGTNSYHTGNYVFYGKIM